MLSPGHLNADAQLARAGVFFQPDHSGYGDHTLLVGLEPLTPGQSPCDTHSVPARHPFPADPVGPDAQSPGVGGFLAPANRAAIANDLPPGHFFTPGHPAFDTHTARARHFSAGRSVGDTHISAACAGAAR